MGSNGFDTQRLRDPATLLVWNKGRMWNLSRQYPQQKAPRCCRGWECECECLGSLTHFNVNRQWPSHLDKVVAGGEAASSLLLLSILGAPTPVA